MFEYLGQTADHARCLDEHGKIRLYPIKFTSLSIPTTSEHLSASACIVSVDDILSIIDLVDALQSSRQV